MKKYIYVSLLLLGAFFMACNDDIDDKLPGIDELDRPWDVNEEEYIFVDADYTTVANALEDAGYTELSEQMKANKYFWSDVDPHTWVDAVLKKRYPSADVRKSANVTYRYNAGAGVLDASAKDLYSLINADYGFIWKDLVVESFTPAKSPEKELPYILKKRFDVPEEGTYKSLAYYYSKEEPIKADVIGEKYTEEDFSSYEGAQYAAINKNGWASKAFKGGKIWQANVYDNDWYAQASSNKSNEENDIWMVSPKNDLTKASSPYLSFDIKVGFYNADCLSILISTDYDGKIDNVNSATWVDVTKQFKIPQAPINTWGNFEDAGRFNLSAYKGKQIYVAFRYQGDDTTTPKKTTSYQIDEFKVYELIEGLDVEYKELVYDLYESTGTAWKKSSTTDFLVLQPADYEEMGKTYLTTADAERLLPVFLSQKYAYLEEGTVKTVVFNTSATATSAMTFVKNGDTWVNQDTKTERYVFAMTDESTNKTEWIFDPTLTLTMGYDDYNLIVDYIAKTKPEMLNPREDRRPSEMYYGFSAYYQNITYRESDRELDPDFPSKDGRDKKLEFMNERTVEAIGTVYLPAKYPDAKTTVSGVAQEAKITVLIYDIGNQKWNVFWTYRFECIGDKEWKFIERVSEDGDVEKAEE